MSQLTERLLVVVLFFAPAACGLPVAEDQAPTVTVRDSADIEIVENHAPVWNSDDFWTVETEPEFVIGGYRGESGAADDASHLVWGVTSAVPLSDGRVAVLSGGEAEVLVFDRSGTLSASFGGRGRGPGEFSNPQHFQVLPGDTIVVWDHMFGRISHFDPSGALLRERRIDLGAVFAATRTGNQRAPETVDQPFPDGSFLVEVRRSDWPRPEIGDLYRAPIKFVRIDSAYAAHSFGWWDGPEYLAALPMIPGLLPFRVQPSVTAAGSPLSVYVSGGDRYEIQQFSATGALRRIVRRATFAPIPIADGEINAWKERLSEAQAARGRLDWRGWDGLMAEHPPRPSRPPVVALHTDTEGNLWVGNRLDPATSEWSIFGPEGRWLGTLKLPLPRITWLGRDLIVGVQRDPDTGVQTVEGYRLRRP